MNRLPWAPLNASVFFIILGVVILAVYFTGLGIFTGFPLIFTLFGAWMIVEGFVIPSASTYAPPRIWVASWGALIAGVGILWLVLYLVPVLLPIVFALALVLAGIIGVAYVFLHSKPNSPKTSTS